MLFECLQDVLGGRAGFFLAVMINSIDCFCSGVVYIVHSTLESRNHILRFLINPVHHSVTRNTVTPVTQDNFYSITATFAKCHPHSMCPFCPFFLQVNSYLVDVTSENTRTARFFVLLTFL